MQKNTNSNVEVIVGKPYPIPNKFLPNTDIHYFEANQHGAYLYIGFPHITDFEKIAVRKGTFKFTVADMGNIAFFLSEITDMNNNLGVSDSGFHASLLFDSKEEIPPAIYKEKSEKLGKALGMPLTIILINTSTMIVQAIRDMSLSTTFSDKLATLLHKQFNEQIDIQESMKRIKKVQDQYEPHELYKVPNFGYEQKVF
ncbi:hypothetical protein ABC382_00785 [Lysinibacillus sp. 1P01SD]|uniref:hypothetical protein n=1 Tax=Lysinibacillus sp. 1P01SD TaxID=3132285 RepID=UPI0039A03F19